jgi:hypothetical protein
MFIVRFYYILKVKINRGMKFSKVYQIKLRPALKVQLIN